MDDGRWTGVRITLAIALAIVGALAGVPVVVILGLVLAALEAVHALWARRGLLGLRYSRRLARERLEWGEETELALEVWNRQWLPLPWLRADDAAGAGVVVRERPTIVTRDLGPALRNHWSLAPFERVVRHLTLTADRRGVFSIGPAIVTVGDLFAREAAARDEGAVSRFLVRPRTLPLSADARPDRWGEAERARRGLAEDPSRFAGIRPYVPGDPLRRIHARASARAGVPLTKRFEPSRERDVLLAIDLQGPRPARGRAEEEERAESLIVVAASLVRAVAAEGAAVGLAAAGFSGRPTRFSEVPVSSAAGHDDRILDLLAHLSPAPTDTFEALLARLHRKLGRTTVLALTGRDPTPFLPGLRALGRLGVPVVVVATGPSAGRVAGTAAAAGIAARVATLDGPWREATRVTVA